MIFSLNQAAPLRLSLSGQIGKVLFVLVLGYSGFGLLFGILGFVGALFTSREKLLAATDSQINLLGYIEALRWTFVFSIVFALVFFALNAYAPGLAQ